MSDGIPTCSRCRKLLKQSAFALALEKGLPESVPQVLQLCPRCIESFERWYCNRGNPPSKVTPNVQSGDVSAMPATSVSKQSKRRYRHKKSTNPLIWTLKVTSLTILLFLLAFYWPWTILIRATRTEEYSG
jgi:hypothetical protein